jgi:hypothetical protein
MNVVMPRSNFDLRDLEAPPRWDALTEADAGLQDPTYPNPRFRVAYNSKWGKGLSLIFGIVIICFLAFAIGWEYLR